MIVHLLTRLTITVLILLLSISTSANATPILFDFNTLTDGDTNAKVQAYMQGVLDLEFPGIKVTVTGAGAEKDYTGDRHVVGPVSNTNTVKSKTLGTSDKGVHHDGLDTFLVNKSPSDRISIEFSFPILSASFDYEIFPDGTCPKKSNTCKETTSNWPDFTFKADGVAHFRALGILPGDAGTYPSSPFSGPFNKERGPQLLGTSGDWSFPEGVTKLEFIDWPRMIGIDNLSVTPVSIPEPGSLLLFGAGLLALAARLRRVRDRSMS